MKTPKTLEEAEAAIREMDALADSAYAKFDGETFSHKQNMLMEELLTVLIQQFRITKIKPSEVDVVLVTLRNYVNEFIDVVGDTND